MSLPIDVPYNGAAFAAVSLGILLIVAFVVWAIIDTESRYNRTRVPHADQVPWACESRLPRSPIQLKWPTGDGEPVNPKDILLSDVPAVRFDAEGKFREEGDNGLPTADDNRA